MNTDIERPVTHALEQGKIKIGELLKSVGFDTSNPVHQAALLACERYDLDPLRKEIIVIPRGGVYVTRDGYLRVAHRSGMLDGIVVESEAETPSHFTAVVSVYRKDMRHPFKYEGRYPKAGSNKQYGREMAVTRAERTALSRAFPIEGLHAGGDDLRTEVDTSATVAEIEEMAAVKEYVDEYGQPEPIDAEVVNPQPDVEGEMFPDDAA